MKRLLLVLVCLSGVINSYGQTNISGVINSYTNVSTITSGSCAACDLLCSDVLTVGSSASFVAGDKALIIQMQGATIDQTQSAAFGDIAGLNNTGNYEMVTVSSVPNGTTVNVSPLTKTYSTSTSATKGTTQLIKIPVYAGDVNVNGTLTAQAWNSTAGTSVAGVVGTPGTTGGVLVFIATGKVFMNADIDVSGKGFKGAVHHENGSADCAETRFYGDETVDYAPGARKGEGIAYFVVGKERMRGNQANGGGGGIGHNGGGGGGGNGGIGGYGGYMMQACANITGRGEGGVQLTATATATFMGGGGGAGHSNGTGAAEDGGDGTNGGGIVIIQADSIINTVNTSKYAATVGPSNLTSTGAFDGNAADHTAGFTSFDVYCQIKLNSIQINAQAAQNVTVSVYSQDDLSIIATTGSVAVPAGVSTVTTNFTIPPGVGYRLRVLNTSGGSLYIRATTAFPFVIPDVAQFEYVFIQGANRYGQSANAYNFNISASCSSGGYKIDVSGIDNPGTGTSDGVGGGGAGGSAYFNVNGYRGEINITATGGRGAKIIQGGCHAPGGGGGGGNIVTKFAAPANVNVNAAGAPPGLADPTFSCAGAPYVSTGYNSVGATKGSDGAVGTGYTSISGCSLPVNFISFTGKKVEGVNYLQWITASETNNDYFVIEKSSDGIHFAAIGTVDGKGTISGASQYSYVDESDEKGMVYYRIKQMDFNGNQSYSRIIGISNGREPVDLSIQPNPTDGAFTIRVNGTLVNDYSVSISDIQGKIVYYKSEKNSTHEIEVSSLASGMYFVVFNSSFSEKVVKKLVIY